MKQDEESGLIRRIRGGDLDAYAEIVRRYQDGVWRVVASMLLDRKTAEDLVQQVFLDAYERLDRFREGADFAAWVKGIARNRVKHELRTRAREHRRLEVYQTLLEQRLRDDAATDEYEEALGDALRLCREQLPDRGAEALRLRYDDNRSFDDVAAALGRTVEATRQLLFRVRALLRECIERRLART